MTGCHILMSVRKGRHGSRPESRKGCEMREYLVKGGEVTVIGRGFTIVVGSDVEHLFVGEENLAIGLTEGTFTRYEHVLSLTFEDGVAVIREVYGIADNMFGTLTLKSGRYEVYSLGSDIFMFTYLAEEEQDGGESLEAASDEGVLER